MEKKLMNDVIIEVEKLKNKILNSEEYLNFKTSEKKLDNNKEINEIITLIKKVQQKIIKKEDKNEETEKEKIELESLYKKLETFNDYIEYKKNARIFNDIITNIQKKFEDYFNKFII